MTRSSLVFTLAAVALSIGPAARHAHADKPGAKCPAAEFRQFDFWVGDWDTFDMPDTTKSIARTHVDHIAGGCGIHELYEQTDGLIGDSILSYDPVRKVWQQTWITNGGSLLSVSGVFKDGAITMEGEYHSGKGTKILNRITWKPEGAGVRETSTASKDGGKTWEPNFDVLFKKHK